MWWVYIVKCQDQSLYTWITIDVKRRISEHNGLLKGGKWAKYTRMKGPVELMWQLQVANRSEASKKEYEIKKMTRLQKLALIAA